LSYTKITALAPPCAVPAAWSFSTPQNFNFTLAVPDREHPCGRGFLAARSLADFSAMMRKHRIDVWCHGHTHTNTDFVAEGNCRVLSNQRGYPREIAQGIGFRENFVFAA
jgi:hypothetical protein